VRLALVLSLLLLGGCHAFRAAPVCRADSNCPAEQVCEVETGECVAASLPPADAGDPPPDDDDAGVVSARDAGPDGGGPPPRPVECGDGYVDDGEACDPGPDGSAGCDDACEIVSGFDCRGAPSQCFPTGEITYIDDGQTLSAAQFENEDGRAFFVSAGDHPPPGVLRPEDPEFPPGGWVIVGEVDADRRPLSRFVRDANGVLIDVDTPITVSFHNVAFDGAGFNNEVVRLRGGVDARLVDVEVTGSGDKAGIRSSELGTDVLVRRCRVHDNGEAGVFAESGATLVAESNFVFANGKDGVHVNNPGVGTRIVFNTLVGNVDRGVRCQGVVTAEHNLSGFNDGPDDFEDCALETNVLLDGTSDPFVARPDDLHLASDTPTIDAVDGAPLDIDLQVRPLGSPNPGADER
jgi:hypothetical protein